MAQRIADRETQINLLRSALGADSVQVGDHRIDLTVTQDAVRLDVYNTTRPSQRPMLQLRTFSSKSVLNAAAIVKDGSKILFLHDGRIREHGLSEPFSQYRYVHQGRLYSVVGYVDKALPSSIIDYHQTQFEDGPIASKSTDAFDPGPKKPWVCPEAIANASMLHNKICYILKSYCEKQGCITVGKIQGVQADLIVKSRKGQKILFEVKPDGSGSSIYSAIGQLIVYGSLASVDERVIIAPFEQRMRARIHQISECKDISWFNVNVEVEPFELDDALKTWLLEK